MKIKFYVPSTDSEQNESQELLSERTDAIAKEFAKNFGGATAIPSTGYYTMETGELVKESVNVVETIVPKLDDETRFWLIGLASYSRTKWEQESILVEFGDEPIFVS